MLKIIILDYGIRPHAMGKNDAVYRAFAYRRDFAYRIIFRKLSFVHVRDEYADCVRIYSWMRHCKAVKMGNEFWLAATVIRTYFLFCYFCLLDCACGNALAGIRVKNLDAHRRFIRIRRIGFFVFGSVA